MPRKFGNEIRLPGTTGIDNLPIPLTIKKMSWCETEMQKYMPLMEQNVKSLS